MHGWRLQPHAGCRACGWDGAPRLYSLMGQGVPPGSGWRSVCALCLSTARTRCKLSSYQITVWGGCEGSCWVAPTCVLDTSRVAATLAPSRYNLCKEREWWQQNNLNSRLRQQGLFAQYVALCFSKWLVELALSSRRFHSSRDADAGVVGVHRCVPRRVVVAQCPPDSLLGCTAGCRDASAQRIAYRPALVARLSLLVHS